MKYIYMSVNVNDLISHKKKEIIQRFICLYYNCRQIFLSLSVVNSIPSLFKQTRSHM